MCLHLSFHVAYNLSWWLTVFLISLCSCGQAGRRYVYLHCHMNVQSGTFGTKEVRLKERIYTIQMLCLYAMHFVFYRTWQVCEDILFAVLPQNVMWKLWCNHRLSYITQALDSAMHRKKSDKDIWEVGHYRLNTLREFYVNQKLIGIKPGYKTFRFWPYQNYKKLERKELYNT